MHNGMTLTRIQGQGHERPNGSRPSVFVRD